MPSDSDRPLRIDPPQWLKPRALVAGALTLFAVGIVLWLVVLVHQVLFLVFVAMVFATALDIPVARMAKKIPRGAATALTVFALIALLAGVVALGAPTIVAQAHDLTAQLPTAQTKLAALAERLVGHPIDATQMPSAETAGKAAARAIPFVGGVAEGLGASIAVIFMAAFMCWQPRVYLNGAVSLVPPRQRGIAWEFLGRVQPVLQGWMMGTLLSMLVMGLLTASGLWLLGVRAWLFLGVLTFFAEFVPFLGPVIAGAIATLFGFADSPATALKVIALFIALQQIEGHTLVPWMMKRTVQLQPALLIAWQLSMAAAFGLHGLLVATPLLAVIKVAVEYFYLERTLGDVPA